MSAPRMLAALCVVLAASCGPTPPRIDVRSPSVVSVTPQDGQTLVPLTVELQVCFDRPMDPASVTSADVLLSRDDGHRNQNLGITASLSPDGRCLAISPWSPLSPSSHYRLELDKGLLSADGIAISSKSVQYASSFTTVAPAATAAMLLPTDGMLAAPLDLAQVLLTFSAPVALADGGPPFTVSVGGESALAADGRSAQAAFRPGVQPGTQVEVVLAPDLLDESGQAPVTRGGLGFTMGACAEEGPPSLGAGLALARDTDALLQFAVDRPSLCGASLKAPDCPDAGALPSPAECQAPYDPCDASLLCLCTVALVGLCPGGSFEAVPLATGFDGQTGRAPAISFNASPALPGLVLTEVRGGSKKTAFVEVQNRDATPVDLLGLTLSDCGLSLGCSSPKTSQRFGPFAGLGSTTLEPNGYALLVDPSYDPSTAPADALLLSPQSKASLLSLSQTKAQSLAIFSPNFQAVVSSYDGSFLPQSGLSLERVNPAAADPVPQNWLLSTAAGGTPGFCNSVTAGSLCDGRVP